MRFSDFSAVAALLFAAGGIQGAEWKLHTVSPADVVQEWGAAGIDRSIDGKVLKVGGVEFPEGVGSHAAGTIRLDLHGDASRIRGAVGVDDDTDGRGSVRFRLLDGDRVLWDSGVRRAGEKALPFDVALTGVGTLLLQLDDGGDGNTYDHADWLDVRIEYASKAPTAVPDPMTAETANARWRFFGRKGEVLTQSGLQGRSATSLQSVEAIRTYPHGHSGYSVAPTLRMIQPDGSHNVDLRFSGFSAEQLAPEVVRNTYVLQDPAYPIEAHLVITAYRNCDVFTSQVSIRNNGNQAVELLNRDAAFVALPKGDTFVTTFSGEWSRELFNMDEFRMPVGRFVLENNSVERTALPSFPGFVVSFDGPAKEESGDVFVALPAWSGSWHGWISRLTDGHSRFGAGAYPEPVQLAAGETYTSPEVIMTFSTAGKGQASRNLHKWALAYGIADGAGKRPVVLNSWEGVYFTFDQKKIIDMMDGAAAIGAEMFVLDDGWFGNRYPRDNDQSGLGDWQVNTKKLPGGLETLIREANKRGMEFGIWVEPEMVNPKSELFEKHPDWVMQVPHRELLAGRNQYVLDLSQPAVEEFVYQAVGDLLKTHPGIRYIKWDNNCFGLNAGSPHLKDNQGALSDRYTAAYYRILARLRREFPTVIFQACASGGCRVDYGAMRYHEEFWPSDLTNGIGRIPMQWGYSHFFPSKAMASHIGRYDKGDFKLRADVAMTGRLGVELSPDAISAEDRAIVRRGIAAYKELRPLLHRAELYRGRSPHESQTTELTFVASDKREAVFFGFKRNDGAKREFLKLSGLDPERVYRVAEVNPDVEARFKPLTASGRELMERGLEVAFPDKPSSVVAKLTAEK